MARFNAETYDPQAESSPGKQRKAGELVLVVGTKDGPLCMSGNSKPVSKNRRFSQGGDAQLKGKLQRAHATNTPVVLIGVDGKLEPKRMTAMALAKQLGWEAYLTRFAQGIADRAAAAAERATAAAARREAAAAKRAAAKKAAPTRKAAAKKAAGRSRAASKKAAASAA